MAKARAPFHEGPQASGLGLWSFLLCLIHACLCANVTALYRLYFSIASLLCLCLYACAAPGWKLRLPCRLQVHLCHDRVSKHGSVNFNSNPRPTAHRRVNRAHICPVGIFVCHRVCLSKQLPVLESHGFTPCSYMACKQYTLLRSSFVTSRDSKCCAQGLHLQCILRGRAVLCDRSEAGSSVSRRRRWRPSRLTSRLTLS